MPWHIIPGLLVAIAAMAAPAALAAPPVAPGEDVQAAVDATEPGGTVELLPGLHRGPVRLERAVALARRDGPLNIDPTPNGPLHVSGALELVSGTGKTINRVTDAWLCRCGHSQNKPYCDGSHVKAGFRTDDTPAQS